MSGLVMEVRRAKREDADAIALVNDRSIRLTATGYYSPGQIEAWASGVSVGKVAAMIDDTVTFVAVVDRRVVGFANLVVPEGEVDQLYVDPAVGRRGVARALCAAIEAEATVRGIARITTTASLLAAPAFARFGYSEVRRVLRPFNGETFPVVVMAKALVSGVLNDVARSASEGDLVGQTGAVDEELLAGGVANAGAVTRVGGHVLRPSNPHSATIHRFLRSLRAAGFEGASLPVGIDEDGRERLVFIDGAVPVPPFPAWAQADTALASTATLIRRFHEASSRFEPDGCSWSEELADPEGGSIVCHNDVCLENVVFRDGVAVGLLDFDFAAPGRPIYDLVQFARMCVPVDDDLSASRLGWIPADRPARLRLVADVYGLTSAQRDEFLRILGDSIVRGGEFVRRRVEAGDPNFIRMWTDMGGMERFDRRRQWWSGHQKEFAKALS